MDPARVGVPLAGGGGAYVSTFPLLALRMQKDICGSGCSGWTRPGSMPAQRLDSPGRGFMLTPRITYHPDPRCKKPTFLILGFVAAGSGAGLGRPLSQLARPRCRSASF